MRHLDRARIERLLRSLRPGDQALVAHLSRCPRCAAVAARSAGFSPAETRRRPPAEDARLGEALTRAEASAAAARDERRRRLAESAWELGPPPQAAVEIKLDLARWLAELSARQRVLIVRMVRGDPPSEVARRAGVKPASLQKLRGRSLDRLRGLAQAGCKMSDLDDP